MKRLLLAFVFLCVPVAAQIDIVHTKLGQTLYTIAYVGEVPVLLPGGHFWAPQGRPKDYVSTSYISTYGTVVTVYVDCTKLTSVKCALKFALRFKRIIEVLPIDKAATKKWVEAGGADPRLDGVSG